MSSRARFSGSRGGVAREERLRDTAREPGCVATTRKSHHDGSLHHQLPGGCKPHGTRELSFRGELMHEIVNRSKLRDGLATHAVVRLGSAGDGAHERTALELVALEPLVEKVEHDQQSSARSSLPPSRLRFQPSFGPPITTMAKKRDDEVVLGAEVAVEGRLGDAGTGDDVVDPDLPYALSNEKVVSGPEHARRAV